MKTLEDLQWYILRCVDAKYEDGGPRRCLRLKWTCGPKVSEGEVRQVARFVKSRLVGRLVVEVIVVSRNAEGLVDIKFINTTIQCRLCEDKVDCLTAERL